MSAALAKAGVHSFFKEKALRQAPRLRGFIAA
jgi:hypothetical protein